MFQSGRQESNLPSTVHQTVASPPRPRPEKERPVRESNPSFPVDSRVDATSLFTGQQSVQRESHPPVRRGKPVPLLLGHGHKQGRKESNPLRVGWNHTALPGARPSKSGWSESNRRSPASEAGGLPGFPTS